MSNCLLVLLASAYVVAVSVATRAGDRQDTQPPLGHGDPCGYSPNQNLTCCIGLTMSTLIYMDEMCCNGRPVGPGQMCCEETAPVPLMSPDHDDCCLDPATRQHGLTFNSRSHFCNPSTGQVSRIPLYDWLASLVGASPQSSHPSEGRNSDLPASSSSVSLQNDDALPFSHHLCEAGSDENRSLGPRWHGERAQCCGRVSYYPSRQTCCAGVLSDLPTEEAQCCYDQAYSRGDQTNPCLGRCRGSEFNSEYELCCGGVIHASSSDTDVCCGRDKISTDTHVCCGDEEGAVSLPKQGPHRCCRQTMPFIQRYMRCGRHGRLSRKSRGRFQASGLCQHLPTWGSHWPTLRLDRGHSQLIQIEGRATHVSRNHHNNVRLTLNSVRLIQSPPVDARADFNASCLESETVQLFAHLGEAGAARKCQRRQLRQYLLQQVLTVFFPLNTVACSESVPTVNFPVSSGRHLIVISSPSQ